MADYSPEFIEWRDEAKKASVYDTFERHGGGGLHKTKDEFVGPCPICRDGTDRFAINIKKNAFFCRHCSNNGDAIELLIKWHGMSFIEAVADITGRPPPGKDVDYSRPLPDPDVQRERRESDQLRKLSEEEQAKAKKAEERGRIKDFFDSCKPFHGSLAEKYLRIRGIVLTPDQSFDLRFCQAMMFRGYADEGTSEDAPLGEFPAMLAAIRDVSGTMIGVHRTYLNAKTGLKLSGVGDPARFKAKKVWGAQKGGFIALSPPLPDNCMGEGLETTASFYQLGIGPDPLGMIVGINLGNISGGATGAAPHPKFPRDTRRAISNGVPDEKDAALVLPSHVKSCIFLGDGDSDAAWTRAKILTAARRAQSYGVSASVCFASDGKDFNNILLEMT